MEVFLLVYSSVYDGDDETSISVFSTYSGALEAFQKMIVEVQENDHLINDEDVVIEKSEDSFAIYREGWYSDDHLNIYIEAKKVLE